MMRLLLGLLLAGLVAVPCTAQELIWEHATPGAASSISFARDGTRLAIRAGAVVELLDPKTGEVLAARTIPTRCEEENEANIAFSPDGSALVATVGADIFIMGGKDLEILDRFGTYWPQCLDVSVKGLLAFGDGRQIVVRDLAGGPLTAVESDSGLYYDALAFSPRGDRLAAAGFSRDHAVELWSVDSLALLTRLEGQASYVNTVAFSPDRKLLVSGGGGRDIIAWDIATGRLLWRFTSPRCCAGQCLDVDCGGTWVATGIQPGRVILLALASGEQILGWEAHDGRGVMDVRFDPSGPRLVTSGYDGTLKMWDLSFLGAG